MAGNASQSINKRKASTRGVTLVELVVVLVVMSILAAAGIGTAVGYVKKTQFSTNEQYAESVFQTTQTALLQMQKNGTIDKWIQDNVLTCGDILTASATNPSSNTELEGNFLDKDTFDGVAPDNALPNQSVHTRYVLTYNPSSYEDDQSKVVRAIVQPYFYDATVFGGTITIELDIEKSFDAYKTQYLTARCLSVFFSNKHKEGWGENVIVPIRDFNTRKSTTLIGYYDGYSGTLLDSVYLPAVEEGLKIKNLSYSSKTFTWSAFYNGNNIIGIKNHIYYQFALFTDNVQTATLIMDEDFIYKDQIISNQSHAEDLVTVLGNVNTDGSSVMVGGAMRPVTIVTDHYDYNGETKDVVKKTVTVDAWIYVTAGDQTAVYPYSSATSITGNMKAVPLTITLVTGELDDNGVERTPYIKYSMDISNILTELSITPNSAVVNVYPNAFRSDTLKNLNDDTPEIIPMRRGKEITLI